MSKSTWYEKLVQETYQALLNQETDIENIAVQHNVNLPGKSGTSWQVDVYWEFKIADTLCRTCIECRNYASKIKQSQVAAFNSMLSDIGTANGIMVTRCGFQKGASIYADYYGIRLLRINPVLQEIQMNVRRIIPVIENLYLSYDAENAQDVLGVATFQSASTFGSSLVKDINLCDKNGNEIRRISEILLQYINETGKIFINLNDEYIKTEYGLIKLNTISFDQRKSVVEEQIVVGGGEYIAQIAIEDVLKNTSKYLFSDGSVSSKCRRDDL